MRALFLLLFVLPLSAHADDMVYCQEAGEPNGPVVIYRYVCPPGWIQVG